MPSNTQTGRGPTGRLRNFRAMSAGKLQATYLAVAAEGNDPEALDALTAELDSRGMGASAEAEAAANWRETIAQPHMGQIVDAHLAENDWSAVDAEIAAEDAEVQELAEAIEAQGGITDPAPETDTRTRTQLRGFEDASKLAMNSKSANTVEEACQGRPAILEPKFDGIRLLANRSENGVRLWTRSGKSATGKLPRIEQLLADHLPVGTWLDCEAVAFNPNGTQDWGGAQSVLGSDASRVMDRGRIKLVVFDCLAWAGGDIRNQPFSLRRTTIDRVFEGDANQARWEGRIIASPKMDATDEMHQINLDFGFEGSMVKLLDGTYQSGKRSNVSMKLKATDTVDAIITGFSPSEPGSWIDQAGLIGAIEFTHYQDGQPIEGKCSGMTVAERERVTAEAEALIGTVIEVSYMTRMPGSGKLRHPQFKRLRTDKTADEVRNG